MTAIVRDDAVVVPVSLGSRSYDIIIGRGTIATLGTRIAELRPGAQVFVVSDENVAWCGADSIMCRCQRRFWHKSILRSAAKRRSIHGMGKI